ncbi:hypothetical protein MMC12_000001 [Toensbergia leucococca]|nr:hypothetical protein [Toensbergia leucococca]
MATTSITLPPDYGYVLLTATALTLPLPIFHTLLTSRHRKRAQVPYPIAYAPASEAADSPAKYSFNCAQRSHANFTDNLPTALVGLFVAGLGWPRVSSALGVVWGVARVVYALGYVRADKKEGRGRLVGTWGSGPLVLLGLLGGWVGVGILMG